MTGLEKKLNYRFKDADLIKTALTHSSYANENRGGKTVCNERLEFLGDAVLGMTVAKHLYHSCPGLPEGEMTKRRAELVCEQSLVNVAKALELGDYLYLGKGEEQGGGRTRPSILADAVEAVLAAVMLDGGIEQAEKIVNEYILSDINGLRERASDNKTALQELVQKKSGQVLTYRLADESGPDHKKVFTVEVMLNGEVIGRGAGKSKKEAEQSAAATALRSLLSL